jgi:hypothetical protein
LLLIISLLGGRGSGSLSFVVKGSHGSFINVIEFSKGEFSGSVVSFEDIGEELNNNIIH